MKLKWYKAMTNEEIKWFVKSLREGQYVKSGNDIVGVSEAELKAADIIEELIERLDRANYDLEGFGCEGR